MRQQVGLIISYNPRAHVGVLRGAGGEYFFYENDVARGWAHIKLGAEVSFEVSEKKPKTGQRPFAINIDALPRGL